MQDLVSSVFIQSPNDTSLKNHLISNTLKYQYNFEQSMPSGNPERVLEDIGRGRVFEDIVVDFD
jgi:hypothetical protein